MNAAEYACEFWNGAMSYPHPQFKDNHMQLGYERTQFLHVNNATHDTSYYHNNHHQMMYRQNNDYNFVNYNEMDQIKSEDSCRYSNEQIPSLAQVTSNNHCDNLDKSSSLSAAEGVSDVKFEHLSEIPSIRRCVYGTTISERIGDTIKGCIAEKPNIITRTNNTDDSPALRALLTKPPKENKSMYAFNEESKSKECQQYLSHQIQTTKIQSGSVLSDDGSNNILSPSSTRTCSDYLQEQTELQQNLVEKSENYYPWMKTQGNIIPIK